MPRTVIRTLLIVVLGVMTVAAPGVTPSTEAAAPSATPIMDARAGGPVVLLGTSGLRWDDVGDSTPALSSLLDSDAVAALAVRSVRDTTCPVDGWLAVSAGRRAADAPLARGGSCREPGVHVDTPGGPGQVTGWGVYRAQAAAGEFGADPGLLGSTLVAAGRSIAAVGAGAAIATADRQGRTARVWPGLPSGPQGALDPGGDALGLSHQVTAAVSSGAALVVADLGTIRDVPQPAGASSDAGSGADADTSSGPASRQDQVAGLDTRLGLVIGTLPADATVIVASLADDDAQAHFQMLAAQAPASATGPALTAGLLRSASTRQDGLVQSTDLLPTVLARLGLPAPADAVGSPLTRVPGGGSLDRLQRVAELDQASILMSRLVTPFFAIAGVIELLVLVLLGVAAHRSRLLPKTRHRTLTMLRIAAVTIALVPAATFLANLWPWWRGPLPGLSLGLAVVVAALPLAMLAAAGPWRHHPLGTAGAVGAITVAVLAADVMTGSRLSLIALIGGQPLVAGRFYGIGNPTFGIVATCAVFAALAVVDGLRRRGRPPWQQSSAVAAIGLAMTVIDAAPGLGSDFGGPPALIPAFGLLALWVGGIRVTWRRAGLIALVTVLTLTLVSVLDWLRPAADRSHLGRFAQTVIDGGAGDVVHRKISQNLGLLVSGPLQLLVLPAAVVIVLVLWRPARWYAPALDTAYRCVPLLRTGVGGIGALLLLAFAANDSGTSIPPAALLVLAPLLVTVTAQAVDREETERREAAAAAAARPVKRR